MEWRKKAMGNNKMSFKEIFFIFIKSLHISLKIRSPISILIGIVGLFMALMPTLISLVLQRLTDEVQIIYISAEGSMQNALFWFAILSFCYLFQTFFRSAQNYYSSVNAQNIQEYIKETVMRCSSNVKYKYLDNDGDYLNKISFVQTQSGLSVANSIENILIWIQNFITFISMVVVLAKVDVLIVLALLVTSIPSVILANMYKDEDYKRKTKWMREGKLVIHQFHDCCAQYSMNEVRFFGIFKFLKNKWRDNAEKYISIKNQMTKKHVLYNLLADFLRNIVFFLVLLIVVKQVFDNPEVGLGIFVLVMSIATDFQKTTTSLFVITFQFFSDLYYMKDFFELESLDYEEEKVCEEIPDADIYFKNVTFTYPGGICPVLKQITVNIKSGEKVAIVGENGSGKTTFINLLLGLYEPDDGEVIIGNQIVTESLKQCRKKISAIFQDFGKYEMSILQNITISDLNNPVDEKRIYKLAKHTGLEEIISAQRDGIYEKVGSLSDDGNNLSGGQWQKVAITRAAYRKEAKIMILDEPTAALDPVAEAEVYHNFSELTGDKTTIFVSHRLGICKVVDRILVFDQGKIVEDGSHSELLKQNGLYAQMHKMQAQWYD